MCIPTGRTGRRWVLVAVAACLGLLAPTVAQAAPAVTSVSSLSTATGNNPDNSLSLLTFHISNRTSVLNRQYYGFKVTNDGNARTNLWVKVTTPSGGNVTLATGEDGLFNVGALAANATRVVYFLYAASAATTTDTTFAVQLYEGVPDAGGTLIDQNDTTSGVQSASATITDVVESLNASANKVLSGYVSPATPTLGSNFQIVVNGVTGTIAQAGRVVFTPAFAGSWDPSTFEVVATSLDIGGLTFANQLAFKAVANNPSAAAFEILKSSQQYTVTYTLRASDRTSSDTKPTPVGHLESGNQMKYTNASSLNLIGPIEPVANAFLINASVAPTRSADGLLTYTLTLSNTSTRTLSADLLQDVLPAGTTYVSGSSRYNGAAIGNPNNSAGVLTWSGPFSVAGGSRVTLTYQVQATSVTATTATYTNSATGLVGSTVIDTTLDTTDSVPATATASVNSDFAPDTTAPTVTLTAYAAGSVVPNGGTTSSTAATMTFTANETASFTCSLDGAEPTTCSSPYALSGLRTGGHNFYVYATDPAGNVGTATTTWTITDSTKPEVVSFTSAESVVKTSPIQFRLRFSEDVTGLAAGDFTVTQTTTSGWSVSSVVGSGDSYVVTLSSGSAGTSGTVRATLNANTVSDLAGTPNTGPSANSQSNSVTISNSLAVEILEAQSSPTASQTTAARSASIAFGNTAASYPANRFMCSMQLSGVADSFQECTSPATYADLASGTYVFKVHGQDISVSDTGTETVLATSATVQRTWTVDAAAPTVTITSPAANATVTTATPAIGGVCTDGEGPVTTRLYAGSAATGTVLQTLTANCASAAYSTTPTDLVGGTYTAVSTQTDAVGNVGTSSATTFTVSLAAPTVTVQLNQTLTRQTTVRASGSCKDTATTKAVKVRFTRSGVTTTLDATCGQQAAGVARLASIDATATTPDAYAIDASSLADGTYSVTSSQTDTSNGLTGTSVPATLVVDTVPPPVTIDTPLINARLNSTAPTVSGTCETGDYSGDGTITVTFTPTAGSSGTRTATATCTSGAYSIKPSGANLLVDGVTYTISAQQTDTAGNVGTSNLVTVVIDTTAPTVTITSPASGSNASTNPTISGACESGEGSGTGEVTVIFIAGTVTKTATAQCQNGAYTATPDGSNSLDLTSPNTTYNVTARQTDSAGNTGTSAAISLTVTSLAASIDLDPASDTGSSSTDRITKTTDPTFNVSGIPNGGTGTVSAVGATTVTCTTGTTSTGTAGCTASLSAGTWTVTATTRASGSSSDSTPSAAITVIIDTTAPTSTATITATHTKASTWPVAFTASDAHGIARVDVLASTGAIGSASVCGSSVGAATSGTITCAPTSPIDATYAVAARATDVAGNVEAVDETEDTIVRDTASPAVTITTPGSTPFATSDATPTIAGACETASGTVTVTLTAVGGGAINAAATASCTATAYTVDTATLSDGTYDVTAAQTDAAGNTGTSGTVRVTVDTTGPAVTVDGPSGTIADTTPTITGACETGGTTVVVRIYTGQTATGTPLTLTGVACAGSRYAATVPAESALDGGSQAGGVAYTATATQSDALGTSATGAPQGFTVDTYVPDTTAPTIIAFASTTTSPTNLTTIAFSVTFSEDVTDLATGDVTISGTSGGTGTWTVGSLTGSGSGPYTFTATNTSAVDGTVIATIAQNAVADPSTNRGPASATATTAVTIDRTAPVLTITRPTEGQRTNDSTPALEGACETASGTVTLAIAGTTPATTTACANGGYAVDAPQLADGPHTVTASQTDAAGNVGTSSTRAFTVDTTAPTVTDVTSTKPDGTYGFGTEITVTVTFSENVTVTTTGGTPTISLAVHAPPRGAAYASTASATASFLYVVSGGDATGDLDYAATTSLELNGGTIVDAAGNAATLALPTPGAANSLGHNKAIVIDTQAPTVAITGGDRTTGDDTPTISGTCSEEGRTVTLTLTPATGSAVEATGTCTGGTFTITAPTLTQGAWTASAAQTDIAGNTGTSDPVTVTVDRTGPAVTIAAPAAGATVPDRTPTISGACESASGASTVVVKIYAGSTTAGTLEATLPAATCAGGAYSATPTADLDLGVHTATATQSDAVGNATTSAGRTFTIDTNVPTVADVTSPTANGSYRAGDTIQVHVTFSLAVTVTGTPQLTLETGTTNRAAQYASGSGTTTLTFTYTVLPGDTTPDLDYVDTMSLSASDGTVRSSTGLDADLVLPAPGAAHSLGANKAIVIDTTPPAVTIDVRTSAFTTSTPTIEGSCTTGDGSVTITIDGGAPITAACSGGRYSAPVPSALAEGAHTVVARQTDAAGNQTTSSPATITIDTVVPAVTSFTTTTTSPTGSTTIPYTIVFSEPVSGLTTAAFTITSGAGTSTGWTVDTLTGSGTTYTLTLRGTRPTDGTIEPVLAAASAVDAATLQGPATAVAGPTVTYATGAAVPPVVTITGATAPTPDSAVMAFEADRPSTYECRLNGGAWEACSSPRTYTGLTLGTQQFEVRAMAIDDGLASAPAAKVWEVAAARTGDNASDPNRAPKLLVEVVLPDVIVAEQTFTGSIDARNVGDAPANTLRVAMNVPTSVTIVAVRPIGISPIPGARQSRKLRPQARQTGSSPCTVEGLVATCNTATLDPDMRYRLEVDMRTEPVTADLSFVGTARNPQTSARTVERRTLAHVAPNGVRCTVMGEGLIRGTTGDDVICGSPKRDRIFGLGGNDRIYAGGGNDFVYGGAGDDRVVAGDGDDWVDGGHGRDVLFGNAGRDTLLGRQGDDVLGGGRGADDLHGGLGATRLSGVSPLDRHFLIVPGALFRGWNVYGNRDEFIERLIPADQVCQVAAC